jgi:glycosyltransferase involved in cell wall biosynthesis
MISYGILACNEHEELDRLLTFLCKFVGEPHEIVVILDDGNTTDEVYDVIDKFKDNIGCFSRPLDNNFAEQKNFLTLQCQGQWIFNIDADEMPCENLMKTLNSIVWANPDCEAFTIPRVNTVEGLTEKHIKKWGWIKNEKDWINFPDYQMRVYRNIPDRIKWTRPVHEHLTGFRSYTTLPPEEDFCLYHPKEIKKQEKQNKMYEKI